MLGYTGNIYLSAFTSSFPIIFTLTLINPFTRRLTHSLTLIDHNISVFFFFFPHTIFLQFGTWLYELKISVVFTHLFLYMSQKIMYFYTHFSPSFFFFLFSLYNLINILVKIKYSNN